MQQTAGGRVAARPAAIEWLQWLLLLPVLLIRMLFATSAAEPGTEGGVRRPLAKAVKKAAGFEKGTSACGVIKDSRKQGEFGAKKFIKP
jgi:hypothetical protein